MANTAREVIEHYFSVHYAITGGGTYPLYYESLEKAINELRELLPEDIKLDARGGLNTEVTYTQGFNDCLAKVKEVLK